MVVQAIVVTEISSFTKHVLQLWGDKTVAMAFQNMCGIYVWSTLHVVDESYGNTRINFKYTYEITLEKSESIKKLNGSDAYFIKSLHIFHTLYITGINILIISSAACS